MKNNETFKRTISIKKMSSDIYVNPKHKIPVTVDFHPSKHVGYANIRREAFGGVIARLTLSPLGYGLIEEGGHLMSYSYKIVEGSKVLNEMSLVLKSMCNTSKYFNKRTNNE